jgi:hypothetical protein
MEVEACWERLRNARKSSVRISCLRAEIRSLTFSIRMCSIARRCQRLPWRVFRDVVSQGGMHTWQSHRMPLCPNRESWRKGDVEERIVKGSSFTGYFSYVLPCTCNNCKATRAILIKLGKIDIHPIQCSPFTWCSVYVTSGIEELGGGGGRQWTFRSSYIAKDRLCGLVVSQSSWLQIRRPGFDSRHYQKKK